MKHLLSAILAALALGALCLSSSSHAQDWTAKPYIVDPGSVDVGTNFPDPQGQYAAYNLTSAFANTSSPGNQAHANGSCSRDFEYTGSGNPVYKSLLEGAQIYGMITKGDPRRPPGNPTTTATVTLMSFSLIGTQGYDQRSSQTVGIPLRAQTIIHRTLRLNTQASDMGAQASASGSIDQF